MPLVLTNPMWIADSCMDTITLSAYAQPYGATTDKLGSTALAKQLEAITCRWQDLCLTIYDTRILDGNHSQPYIKKMLTACSSYPSVISLQQTTTILTLFFLSYWQKKGQLVSIIRQELLQEMAIMLQLWSSISQQLVLIIIIHGSSSYSNNI